MAVDIGPKIGIDGESEFRKQLQNVNQSLKTLGSEMKLVTAEFAENAKSEEALTAKNDVLERSLLSLQDKLAMQEKALKDCAKEYGESNEKTMKWQQAVNETKAALANTENQIRKNADEIDHLGDEVDDTADAFKDAGGQAASFGDVLKANVIGDLVIKGVEALANGIKKVGKAFKDTITDSAAFADEMITMSQTTGLSTDALQEYRYMSDLVDVNLETITGALSKLTKNMSSAKKGTGDTAKAFKTLRVNIVDSNGALRDNQDVFNEVLDALGGIENETERDAIAMQIFGKSAQDLLPMIIAGGDAVKGFAKEAHDMGYVLDSETLNSLGAVQESFDRFHLLTDTIKNNLAMALAPVVEDLANKFIAWAQSVDWDAVSEKVNRIAEAIQRFFGFISENGDTIVTVLAAIAAGFVAFEVTSLIMGVVEAFSAFREALIAGKTAQEALNLAMSLNPATIVITAISALVAALIVLWNTNEDFRNWCINAWNDIITWIKGAVDDVDNWIKNAWQDIQNFFKRAGEWFKNIGHNIVTGIWEGIKNAANWLVGKVTGFFNDIVEGVKSFLGIQSPSKVFAEIGRFMAEGLGEGWEEGAKPVFKKVVEDIRSGYTKAFESVRGTINSQIKLFDDYAAAISEDTDTVDKMLERWSMQTENLTKYTENLKRATAYGFDKGLIESLSGGSAESAGYLSTIIQKVEELGEGTEEAAAFINDFNASFSATTTAKDEFAKTVASMRDEIGYELSQMPDEWLTAGEDMVTSMVEGIDMESSNLYNKVVDLVKTSLYKAREAMGTLLPTSSANAGVVSSMTGSGLRDAMADSVNAIGVMNAANANTGDLQITIQADGREFYRATIDDFRLVSSQNPVILNDF